MIDDGGASSSLSGGFEDPMALLAEAQERSALIGATQVVAARSSSVSSRPILYFRRNLTEALLVRVVRKVAVSVLQHRASLAPTQAIAVLQCLAVSGIAQNAVFASLLAVVDNARRDAPLLEADVLALCSVVAYLAKLGQENRLCAAAAVDLDCARAAAQDALGQFLRYLVRSRSLDRVEEFGRLLDAVVTVLATTIDVHTMQALSASCMTRAQRGHLSPGDVELILRVISNRLAASPQLAHHISRTVLPDLRRHVALKCFPTMTAPVCCAALSNLHTCSPLQHCATAELDSVVLAFEARLMQVGRQLDAPAVAQLCVVYRDLQRTSPVLLHVLTHLTTLRPDTLTAKHVRDIATATTALRTPHPQVLGFLESRAVHVVKDMDQSALCDTLKVFAPGRSQALGAAVAHALTTVRDDYFISRFDAFQAASMAQSLVLLGVANTNLQLVYKMLAIVYAERRGSRVVSNSSVVSQLLFVFDALGRNVHPELYDLVSPRRVGRSARVL